MTTYALDMSIGNMSGAMLDATLRAFILETVNFTGDETKMVLDNVRWSLESEGAELVNAPWHTTWRERTPPPTMRDTSVRGDVGSRR